MAPRVLELPSDFLKNPTRLSVAFFETLMLWPADDEQRTRALQSISLRHAIASGSMAVPSNSNELKNLVELLDSLPRQEELIDACRELFTQGVVAGAVLLEAVGMASIDVQRVKMSAIKRKFATGPKPFRFSEKTIDNRIWRKFRSVSPFWAACLYLYNYEDGTQNRAFPCTVAQLSTFLATADEFRKCAERLHTPRSPTATLLNADESIRMPTTLILPLADLSFSLKN